MVAPRPAFATLIYLFADRIVPASRFLTKATKVPCKDVEVRTDLLARLLLASSFWGLREQGLIGLAVVTKRRWIFERTQVQVVRLKQTTRSGLEGMMLDGLGGEEDDDVTGAICRAFEETSRDPWNEVVHEVVRDAIASGYIKESGSGGEVAGRGPAGSQRELRPRCREIAALDRQFESFASRWERFRSDEPALHEGLLEQSASALNSCTDRYYV